MKKTALIIFVLLALGVVAGYFIYNSQQQKIVDADRKFYVENSDAITKIFMADKTGKKVLLEKVGKQWIVNGKHKVFQPKIDMLLETIRRVRVDYPVSAKQWDHVVRTLSSKSTKVEIYTDHPGEPHRVYFIGYETLDGLGTYAIMQVAGRTAKQPYVMHIPGFMGSIEARYFLDEKDWRDLNVFDFKMEEIQEVSLQWTEIPDWSFTLQAQADGSYVMPENTEGYPLFTTGVDKFLHSFTFLNAEALESEHPRKDSILNAQEPFLILKVTPKNGNAVSLSFYRMETDKRTKHQYDESGTDLPFDIDRYWGVADNGLGFVMIQDFVFGKVMRRKNEMLSQQGRSAM